MKRNTVILQSVLFSFMVASTGLVYAQTPTAVPATAPAAAVPVNTKEIAEKKEAVKAKIAHRREMRKEHREKMKQHHEMRAKHREEVKVHMKEKMEAKAEAKKVEVPAQAVASTGQVVK